jgi:hypothetical protein
MKTNRLIAVLIISNVLLIGLLGMLPRSASVSTASPLMQPMTGSQKQTVSTPFQDTQKSMKPSEDISGDAAPEQAASRRPGDLQVPHGGSASLPLVSQESDPNTNLGKADLPRRNLMRENFINAIGEIHHDPKDPQNLSRWQKAQEGRTQLQSNDSQATSEEPVSLPLAFLEPDAGANLNQEDQTTLKTLRDNFIKEIGGLYQDPNDPQYQNRWGEAESEADALYKVHMGEAAYVKMLDTRQRQSWLQSP